jgi:hypothetical protein
MGSSHQTDHFLFNIIELSKCKYTYTYMSYIHKITIYTLLLFIYLFFYFFIYLFICVCVRVICKYQEGRQTELGTGLPAAV